MTSQKAIDDFLSIKNIAVVGVSREKGKFGNAIYKELKKKGFNTFGINPNLYEIEGDKCYSCLKDVQQSLEGVVTCLHPSKTASIVMEAKELGINNVWMQQGSESDEAIKYCQENGMNEIHKECILMFAKPVKSFHSFHKWIWKVLGKLPE